MNILLTGGLGFIGSHTAVEILQNTNYRVIFLDNLYNSNPLTLDRICEIANNEKVTHKCFSILEKDKLEEVFKNYNIDCVIHFAALKSVPESISNPSNYYQTNIIGSINLLDCMVKYNVKKIVFSSSATVYSDHLPPLHEDMSIKLNQTNPYGTNKAMMEKIIEEYSRAYGINAINLRYFNPIGAHPSGLIGENPKKELTNLFPSLMDVLKGKKEYLHIFGDDYQTEDGSAERDYIHICDLASAHLCAVRYLNRFKGCIPINVGYGYGTSVFKIIKIFEEQNNIKIPIKISPRREGDLPSVYCVPDKAKTLLGWKPKFTIEDACLHAYHYFSNQ